MGSFDDFIQHIIRGYEDGSQTIKRSLDTTFENSKQYLQEQKEYFEHVKTKQLENLKSLEEEQKKVWGNALQQLQTEYIKTVDLQKHNLGQLIQQFQVQQQQQQEQCINTLISMKPFYYFSSMEEKLFESKKGMQECVEKLKISTQLKYQQLLHLANNDNNNNNESQQQQQEQETVIQNSNAVGDDNGGYSTKKGAVSVGVQCDLIKPSQINMNSNLNGDDGLTVYSNYPTKTYESMNNKLSKIEDFYSYTSELFWDESAYDNPPPCDKAILDYDTSLRYGNIYNYNEFSPAHPVDFYWRNDPPISLDCEEICGNTSNDNDSIEDIYKSENADDYYMAEVYESDQLASKYDALVNETEKCQEVNDENNRESGECSSNYSSEKEYDVIYSILEESIEADNGTDIENENSIEDFDMDEKKDQVQDKNIKNNEDWEIL
ncbi:hypothetical protein BJ944DRAFT_229632 [Cunninghamella echinulata]|nr:hypothetical protein BJ944DRAFT_229632 [Cunninghamella echinulata]